MTLSTRHSALKISHFPYDRPAYIINYFKYILPLLHNLQFNIQIIINRVRVNHDLYLIRKIININKVVKLNRVGNQFD